MEYVLTIDNDRIVVVKGECENMAQYLKLKKGVEYAV